MKVIFFGTPDFAVPSLAKLLAHPDFEVLGVVTQPDKRRGRGNQLTPSPVKELALAHNLPVWQPDRVKKDAPTLQILREAAADLFAVVAYGQILSAEILAMPSLGCVNVHGSLLPKYRGAAPIQWCICRGETETGITTMQMDVGMDTGPMLLERRIPIGLFDDVVSVSQTLADLGADLLVETLIGLWKGEIQPIPQPHDQATYAPLIQKQDYLLNWSEGAKALHDRIRGFFPNCVASFRGQSLKILATAPLTPAFTTAPEFPPELVALAQDLPVFDSPEGAVVKIAKGIGPFIQTGDGLLLLRQVQLAGKRPQSGWDFANGNRLAVGESLLTPILG
ncbi:MAG: methionyl-tRNA formyltransferase [Oscillatoriaceae cyanobacterium]